MSSSSSRRLALAVLLGLLLGQGAARLAAQPSIIGGGGVGGTCATVGSLGRFTAAFTLGCSRLIDDGTSIVEQRSGATAQTLRVYNTFTDASNYSRGAFGFIGNVFTLSAENAGSGATTTMNISAPTGAAITIRSNGASTGWQIGTAGAPHLIAETDNTLDIGASGAGRPRDIFLARNLVGAAGGFFNSVLTNTAPYAAITGAACGAATECFFAIGSDGTVPAGSINAAKHRIELEVAGVYGANATDTLTLNFKICTVSGCGSGTVITLATSGAVTMSAATAKPWNARIVCNVFTAGASGTLDCQGIPGGNFFTAISTVVVDDIFNSGTVAVDTTVAEFISVSATWSSTNAANTITLRNFGVKVF